MAVDEAKEQVRLVTGVGKEAEKLTRKLRTIQTVLHDAEKRQIKEETVRLWLDQLRDACYDMEDVLGEWNTAKLKLQIDGVDDHENDALVPKKKVCSFFPAASCFACKPIFLRRRIALKMKDINETLDDIAKQKAEFGFAVNVINSNERADQRVPSISLIDESEIFGRETQKNDLVNKLLCESSEEQKGPCVISLVGMGGIGKTTLAQLAYNNDDVKNHFEKRIWVCVSDPFDVFRIARAIIEALTGSAPNFGEFQSLMQHVQGCVEGKKFLLVLDDVWNKDYSKWGPFYNCLKNGLHGSKILITTRDETTAHIMKSTDIIPIDLLSEKECWSIFESLAFFGKSMEGCENLEKIGREIVGKCKGLPLAVKTIGSLLWSKSTEEEWQNILKSEIWEHEGIERGLLAPLLLSYNELPSKVKHCFSYCAVFPKDFEIWKYKLINLWMAQGYLNEKGNKEMEDIGEEYFNILASSSFFQEFKTDGDGKVYKCKMHDLVHDLAQFICRNECLTVKIHGGEESIMSSFEQKKVLHLMLTIDGGTSVPIAIWDNVWNNVKRMRRLRSLLVEGGDYSWSSKVLPRLFDKLTCLRALTLETHGGYNFIKEIPTNIEKLIHLKYLSLASQTGIKKLPETVCELYNLERLNITSCNHLRELPQGIGKLRKLMYLDNDDTSCLRYLPVGIGELINLRRVTKFVVGGGYNRACSLGSLKKLNLLRQCSIRGLGGVSDVGEARRAELEKKKNLSDLELHFGHLRDGDEEQAGRRENEEDEDERLLEALGAPPNLKRLEIYQYRGRRNVVPINWFMSLTNLRDLSLFWWRNCEHLPPLGKLKSLESLLIYGMQSVKRVGNEFLGVESDTDGFSVIAFPKLKHLEFEDMEELEEWDFRTAIKGEIIIMPRLSCLTILSCRKLKAVPNHLLQKSTLQNLEIFGECPILQERCRKETGELICHIPKISIA
ncbi:putative disease resistance protein RGA3 [Citrus sinensis]|uniref:putative disease resistance protein RGA3 n=1 Tax=Citrus sinensis TaxID=2711 RepID=UPI0022774B97|nr:putative disease resistance protein RGA3 [Citrus sinensis]